MNKNDPKVSDELQSFFENIQSSIYIKHNLGRGYLPCAYDCRFQERDEECLVMLVRLSRLVDGFQSKEISVEYKMDDIEYNHNNINSLYMPLKNQIIKDDLSNILLKYALETKKNSAIIKGPIVIVGPFIGWLREQFIKKLRYITCFIEYPLILMEILNKKKHVGKKEYFQISINEHFTNIEVIRNDIIDCKLTILGSPFKNKKDYEDFIKKLYELRGIDFYYGQKKMLPLSLLSISEITKYENNISLADFTALVQELCGFSEKRLVDNNPTIKDFGEYLLEGVAAKEIGVKYKAALFFLNFLRWKNIKNIGEYMQLEEKYSSARGGFPNPYVLLGKIEEKLKSIENKLRLA